MPRHSVIIASVVGVGLLAFASCNDGTASPTVSFAPEPAATATAAPTPAPAASPTSGYDPSIDTEDEAVEVAEAYARDMGATTIVVDEVRRDGQQWRVRLSGGPFMEETCEPPEEDDGDDFACPTHGAALLVIAVGTGAVSEVRLTGTPPP